MATGSFVHLHCHTHYSLLDGASRVPELVAHTKSQGMNAVAITDHGNLYGAIEFYRECKAAGINPIIGYEAYVAPTTRFDREAKKRGDAGFHLTLLAQNRTGFKNLIKMASIAFLEGYYYVPRIDKEILKAHKEGIICLSGCASAEFSEHILKGNMEEAERLSEWFADLFGKNFYVEIQNNNLQIQRICAEGAIDIARKKGLPLVATSDAHYLCRADSPAHDVLLCINTGAKRTETKRMRYEDDNGRVSDQFYVKSPAEMYSQFPEHADAVQRSQEIADSVHIDLDFKARHFPVFSPPVGKTPEQYLRELCYQGMTERYGENPAANVIARLDHELGVICRMGFASYFLIVGDFVRFAVDNNIPCSARGSGCGAVVSYVLKLSHVDPLEYDLLFERFLDPNRAEAPDIDIDFCQNRREEVIAYVKKKYGEESVAQIATFGTLAARAAIKDVGRVLDVPLERVNQLTGMIPTTLHITIDESLEQSPDLKQAYETDPLVHELIDIARKLEGTNRNAGTHAAGVVISNGPLTDYVPLQKVMRKGEDAGASKGEKAITTQWVMGDIEKVGLLKMDFLGLRTLTLIEDCLKLIEQSRGQKIDIFKLPLDDQPTYKLLQRGDAKGVFQFESDGIRELLKRLKPDNIRDIIACTALYRPGPLQGGMVDSYVNRKHGLEKPEYAHPMMEEVLHETHGIMCIHEDTRISMADGTEKPIRDVRLGDHVHALNLASNRFDIRECHGCGPTRRENGIRITLENGFSVTLTSDHKVRTFNGWKEAGQLNPEQDLVTVALQLTPEQTTGGEIAPWLGQDEDVAYLLGILIGDGCLTSCGVIIASGVKDATDRLVVWLQSRFPTLRVKPYFCERSWFIRLSSPELLNDPKHGNRKTRLHHLLEQLGMKVKAQLKRVPTVIFRCAAEVRAAFLAGLIDSDGCLATNKRGASVAFLSSTSTQLLQDVRRLLQLEGIAVHLRPLRLHVWDIIGLQRVIGPHLVVKAIQGTPTAGQTYGRVPRSAIQAKVLVGESVRGFERRTGILRPTLSLDQPFAKSSTAFKAGIALGDVRHMRILSLEIVPQQQFYGMSVAEHHNLVANGIVVKNCYQEQIMQVLNRLGGIELASAYACIKAISKKKKETIDQRHDEFVKGAATRGMETHVAEDIWDKIVFFAGYGFNKSHSAAYALVSYQTAYLKQHYTAEFMAALLSSEIDDGNKRDMMVDHIADARKLGVQVLPPCVNASDVVFSVQGEKTIIFGLLAIKGLGHAAADEIVRARKEGDAFKDLFDFCERVDVKSVPRGAMEKLVKAGAMDRFGGHRAQLLHALPRAIQSASEKQDDKRKGQGNLFEAFAPDGGPASETPQTLPDVPAWPENEKLKYEKEALDFYFSSHPLAQYEKQFNRLTTHNVNQVPTLQGGHEATLGGIFTQVRFMNTKKARNGNSRYARFKLEDLTGSLECVMWPDDFARNKEPVIDDKVCFIKGVIDERSSRTEPIFLVSQVIGMEQMQREGCGEVWLKLRLKDHQPTLIDTLGGILKRTPGTCPVWLSIYDEAGKRAALRLGRSFHVNPLAFSPGEIEDLLGPGSVKLVANGNGSRNGR